MKKPGKFLLLFSTLLALTALTTSAAAQDNYFSWKIGSSQMEVDSISGLAAHATGTVVKPTGKDDVTSFSVAYGHKATDSALPLRMEIELSFRGGI